jgi:hypothetical protein
MRLSDLADPSAVAAMPAWLDEQERLEAGVRDYPRFLKLSTQDERTAGEEAEYQKLRATYDPPATPEQIDEAQASRDRGNHLSFDDAVMLDAAYRASIPRNRRDGRFIRSPQGRKLSARVFRQARTYDRALPRRAPRAQTRRRTVRTSRGSPREDDPEPSPLASSRGFGRASLRALRASGTEHA